MSHTPPNAHARRLLLPACPLTAVSSLWSWCIHVLLATPSFPHGRASVNMGETHSQMRLVPWQWSTLSNSLVALTIFSSFQGVLPHIISSPDPSSILPRKRKRLVLRLLFSRWQTHANFSLLLSLGLRSHARRPPLSVISLQFAHTHYDHRHFSPLFNIIILSLTLKNSGLGYDYELVTNWTSNFFFFSFPIFHSVCLLPINAAITPFVPYFPIHTRKMKEILSFVITILSILILLYSTCF